MNTAYSQGTVKRKGKNELQRVSKKSKKATSVVAFSVLLYPEPESNRHVREDTGV